ncbi:MAG: site-specific integrase [Gallionellaceae bacterium]|jgi:hypothetical protein
MQSITNMTQELPVELSKKPDWRISKMGYRFDFNSDSWQLDGSHTINFRRMRELNEATQKGLRKALCRYAEELSAGTTDNAFAYVNMYCDHTGEKSISVKGMTKWRSTLTSETEYWMGALKAFLLAWNEWGYSGVDNDVAEYLEEQTLKGMVKGKAVRKACPYSGPLTLIEQGALLNWAANAFVNKTIDLSQYSYFLTVAFTGRRAVQIRSLRAVDLGSKGRDYIVKFPRVKQRGVGFREAFRSLSVNEDLYWVLKNQAEASQVYVENLLGKNLPPDVRREIPLFLDEGRVNEVLDINHLVTCLTETPDYLHITHSGSMRILRDVAVRNTARSERTGEFINFTSRRFRYTKGTNLARRGITGVVLAMALDQSDTQNIDVYTANTEEMAERIDEIMSPVLAPLAQAFAGKLIASERDALRANDPHSRVRNEKSNIVGNCGTHAFCASGYRACYTCLNFQAWRDAPHEEVLEELLVERKRQEELGVSPNVIQSTDLLVLAVQQVILMCNQAKSADGMEVDVG